MIIFDGLDELASQGKAAAETAREFIREVERTVEKRNTNGVKLRVLFSGRELIVQQNESEFRRSRQILNLLPYFVTEKGLVDPEKLMATDQRQQWWRQYGAATGCGYDGLPAALVREDLDEITSQPLLNYLVALSYTRGQVDFEKTVNLNEIYADLLAAVYARGYEKKRAYVAIRHMSFDEFALVLEEIGLAAWHGDGRTTTVREIEEHCRNSNIDRLLKAFKEGAEQGITRLLAAFFFRQYGRRVATGDPTFVFTHKSFGEYLAARRVARAMAKMARERQASEELPGEGWNEKQALAYWAEVCGPSAMSHYLYEFLLNELALRGVPDIARVQDVFTKLFSYVLRHGMPMEMLQLPSFAAAMRHARNAEEALLAALNSCAQRTRQISRIEHPDDRTFKGWLARIQAGRNGEGVLVMRCLSYLSLPNLDLVAADLMYADFTASDLSDTYLTRATCSFAVLDEAVMSRCVAHHADFAYSLFRRTKISDAEFRHAIMDVVDFGGAVIRRSSFRDAAFVDAAIKNIDADDESLISLGLKKPPRRRRK